jgi:hypothetical protein
MNEDAHAAILFTLGALALRLGLTDAHRAYIRPAMGPILAAAGAVLVALGGIVLLAPPHRTANAGHAVAHDGHDHTGASRVAWLLLAPILAIAIIVPKPTGGRPRFPRPPGPTSGRFRRRQPPAGPST